MPRLVIHPPVDPPRLARIRAAAPTLEVINAETADAARNAMPQANAFFGRLTPELLAAAERLQWVQSPTPAWSTTSFPN